MKKKITISVEKVILERAKCYAKSTERSLSEIVGNYLDKLTREERNKPLSPQLQKIVGVVQLPDDFDEEKELKSFFKEKHKI